MKKCGMRKVQSAAIFGGNFLKRTDHGNGRFFQARGMETYATTEAATAERRKAGG